MEKRFEFKEVEHPLDLYDTEIAIVDNETDNIISYDNACIVLNEQDKKIKELENLAVKDNGKIYRKNNQIKKLQEENEQLYKRVYELKVQLRLAKTGESFEKERKNDALKNQNSKAIKVLERLRQDFFGNPYNGKHEYVVGEIINKIDIKITELRGGENE